MKFHLPTAHWLAFLLTASVNNAIASDLTVTVTDAQGKPLQHVIAYLLNADGTAIATKPGTATISQKDTQFVPPTKALTRGSQVTFANEDATRHHVYSFSAAKAFETKLYGNEEAPSIAFEKTGHVALGCNIHDWMRGHILILDTPYHASSDATGIASFTGIPEGDYLMEVWHPGHQNGEIWRETVTISPETTTKKAAVLTIEEPIVQERKLSPLEIKLRNAISGK